MALLAQWLLGIFTALGTFFAQYMTRRVAVAATFTTVLIAMTSAMFIAVKGLIIGVAATVSSKWLLVGMTAVMPANFPLVLSAYFSARLTWWAYNLNKDLLTMYLGGI